jgi:ferredoxin like protein
VVDLNIKVKLAKDTIKADSERHIKVNPEKCKTCKERVCLFICPARVYTLNNEGEVVLELDGCLECGTCRIACAELEWHYPRGGYGVQYKCG